MGQVSDGEAIEGLISTDKLEDFRVAYTPMRITDDKVALSDEATRALDLVEGDTCRIWVRSK